MTRPQEFGPDWITAFSTDVVQAAASAVQIPDRYGATHRRRQALARRFAASPPRFRSIGVAVSAPRVGGAARDRRRRTSHVLPQALFRDLLARDQRRTERYERASTLLLVKTARPLAGTAVAGGVAWPAVVEAVIASTGGLAVVGWFDSELTLGAIVPEMPGADLELALRRELARRVGPSMAANFGIEVRPSASHAAGCEAVPTHPAVRAGGNRAADLPRRDRVKRALDLAATLPLLLLLAPVFVAVAALLKLTSPGPVFFRQRRVGQFAEPFTMLKFRTMRVDADQGVHQQFVTQFIRSGAQLHPVGRNVVFKLTKDKRVTPLGRILRKTSLDELPQLWNVLRGDMSLVGPRPPLAI